MHLSELNPRLEKGNLWFLCPGGCGWEMRVPYDKSQGFPGEEMQWTLTGELPNITLTPSVKIDKHCHFNITNGEIVDHKDVAESYINK